MTETPTPVDEMSYEQALAELETTIDALENSSPSLEESMSLFERGQTLAEHCAALLDKAELRVDQLISDDTNDQETDNTENVDA